jgi:para-aminobenzoate synthetase/4-amino-4-deoxychorismate lyase
MKTAADHFLFKFSYKKIIKKIRNSIADFEHLQIKKIRLLLNKWGKIKIEITDLQEPVGKVIVIISQSKIFSTDRFRYFKTTNRKLYDKEYAMHKSKGLYEVLYLNEKNKLAEGSRSNIFLKKGKQWFTPPLNSGALPGIYRKHFMEKNPEVSERNIKVEDLFNIDSLVLTNALRGEIKVSKVFINNNEFVEFGQ